MSRVLGGGASTRLLNDADIADVAALLAGDPISNVFVAARLGAGGLDPWRLGGELWGHHSGGRLVSLCYSGANLVPVAATRDAVRSFADRARRQGRRCSSIVGPAASTMDLWRLLEPSWGPAREVRADQPVMAIGGPSPTVTPNFKVRPVRLDQLDTVLPACVAMFTEEVGVSPLGADGGSLYRSRVADLVASGRAFAWIENDEVVFKAEIGAATESVCQVQGVWVNPAYRGRGLAAGGMAAVIEYGLRDFSPIVSLYVNAYNTPARRAYSRVGFSEVGSFASVLF
jgi:predicted GNAT family acetyltransferase